MFQLSIEKSGICLLNIQEIQTSKPPRSGCWCTPLSQPISFPRNLTQVFVSPLQLLSLLQVVAALMFLVVCAGPVTNVKEFLSGWFMFLLKYWAPSLIKAAAV